MGLNVLEETESKFLEENVKGMFVRAADQHLCMCRETCHRLPASLAVNKEK